MKKLRNYLIAFFLAFSLFAASTTYHLYRLQEKTYYVYRLSTLNSMLLIELAERNVSYGPY